MFTCVVSHVWGLSGRQGGTERSREARKITYKGCEKGAAHFYPFILETTDATSQADIAAAKEAKKQFAAVNKLVSRKQDHVKDFTLHVCNTLEDTPLMASVTQRLAEHACQVRYFSSPIANIFRWERKHHAKFDENTRDWVPVPEYRRFEATNMIYIQASALLHHGGGIQKLEETIVRMKREFRLTDKHQTFVMIDNMESKYRKTGIGSRAANASAIAAGQTLVKKVDVERALASLQVAQKCFIVHVEGNADAAEWLYNMTAGESSPSHAFFGDSMTQIPQDIGVKPHK